MRLALAMERVRVGLRSAIFAAAILANPVCPASNGRVRPRTSSPMLHKQRRSDLDLALSGDLADAPAGENRYISREDLLKLPQYSFTVRDANFPRSARVSGVRLDVLVRRLAAHPRADLVLAVCSDEYCAPYTRAYLAAHEPILVLNVNGNSPANWPKDPGGSDMGPYLIANPRFAPSFSVLSHGDEQQIPWGVVRVEFRDQKRTLATIAPRGPSASDVLVEDGYRIAQQNCFRCHYLDGVGGRKSGLTWQVLAAWAAGSPGFFAAYVRDPRSKNPKAHMPGSPAYDSQTLRALTSYFRTFVRPAAPGAAP